MGVVTTKRPRRLVLVGAVIALAAALFVAIQAPLSAQSPPRMIIVVDGDRYSITRTQLEDNADLNPPFVQRTSRGGTSEVPADKAISLKKLLDVAGAPDDTRFVVLPLKSGGGNFYANRGDSIAFWFDDAGNQFNWFREYAGGNDANKSDEGIGLERFKGYLGNRYDKAKLSASSETPRAGESVDFEVDLRADTIEGEELTYRWSFGDGKTETTTEGSVSHTYAKKRPDTTVTVEIEGDEGSFGEASGTLNVKAKRPQSSSGGSGSGGSGSGGSGSGGGGSSGGGSSGGGTFPSPGTGSGTVPPAGTTPPPTTPSLPPPSSSPPSGSGPQPRPCGPAHRGRAGRGGHGHPRERERAGEARSGARVEEQDRAAEAGQVGRRRDRLEAGWRHRSDRPASHSRRHARARALAPPASPTANRMISPLR